MDSIVRMSTAKVRKGAESRNFMAIPVIPTFILDYDKSRT